MVSDTGARRDIDKGAAIVAPSTDMSEVRTISTAVTHKPKCYVFVCAGCDLLSQSERSDALTCSTQCRVRAHRNGWLKTLHGIADRMHISAASILQAKAVQQLRPDLADRMRAGTITLDDARPEVWSALWSLLSSQIEASR